MINENGKRDDPTLNGHGIIVGGSDSNVFAFNVISRNEQGGVRLLFDGDHLRGSNNNTIASNIVTETTLDGIVVQVGDNNTIYGNLSTRNERGIALETRASGNFVLRNTALDNTRPDLPDLSDARALETPPCDNNKWRANIFKKDNEVGDRFGPRAGCIR